MNRSLKWKRHSADQLQIGTELYLEHSCEGIDPTWASSWCESFDIRTTAKVGKQR